MYSVSSPSGDRISELTKRSQVMLMLVAWEPYFENCCELTKDAEQAKEISRQQLNYPNRFTQIPILWFQKHILGKSINFERKHGSPS